MRNASKKILVAGRPGYLGALLVRRFLRAGHQVHTSADFVYRKDIRCTTDLASLCHNNLTVVEYDLCAPEVRPADLAGCQVVLYVEQDEDRDAPEEKRPEFLAWVASCRDSEVERIVYIGNQAERKIAAFDKRAAAGGAVVFVSLPEAGGRTVPVAVAILTQGGVSRQRVTLYSRDKKPEAAARVMPAGWYEDCGQKTLDRYLEGIADLCLYACEQSLQKMTRKMWAPVLTAKIFLNRYGAFQKLCQLSRNPHIPGVGYVGVVLSALKRLFDVAVMMVLVHVRPEQAYRFSTRKCLPPPAARFHKDERPVLPFELIESRTSKIPRMPEVNIVMRGASFNIARLEELKGPIVLVSFWEPVETNKEVIYAMGRAKGALRLGKLGHKVIFVEVNALDANGTITPKDKNHGQLWYEQFIAEGVCQRIALFENVYRSPRPPLWPPTNSGLPGICALSYFADKINVYGWDYYLESSPAQMNYWQLYSRLYQMKTDIKLTKTHLESTIINYYYGYHLSKLPNVRICGPLGELDRHERLIGKFERVLFNV